MKSGGPFGLCFTGRFRSMFAFRNDDAKLIDDIDSSVALLIRYIIKQVPENW